MQVDVELNFEFANETQTKLLIMFKMWYTQSNRCLIMFLKLTRSSQ